MAGNDRADLDGVIDDVARAMTSATPSMGLRGAVRERVAAPAHVAVAWAVAAVTVVAALAATATLWWPSTVAPELRRASATFEPSSAPSIADSSDSQPSTPVSDIPVSRRRAARLLTQVEGPSVPSTIEVEQLAIEPLVTAPLQVQALSAMSGIEIDPITVAPLTDTVSRTLE